MRKYFAVALVVGLTFQNLGCATVIKGTTQSIGITSEPSGAWVRVDGEDEGMTPVVVNMKRSKDHTVVMGKDGYKNHEATILRRPGGWIWGNIFIGGLIGLVVDLITSANNNLVPEKVHADLQADDSAT